MSTVQLKERLHLQIEQLDEKNLVDFHRLFQSFLRKYQPEVILDEESIATTPQTHATAFPPLSKQDVIERAKAANEDFKQGRVHTLSEIQELFGL